MKLCKHTRTLSNYNHISNTWYQECQDCGHLSDWQECPATDISKIAMLISIGIILLGLVAIWGVL